jgi:hypothetical protein
MSGRPTPTAVLDSARAIVGGADDLSAGDGSAGSAWGGSWSRAAAFLIRCSLEDTVADLWISESVPALAECALSTQLLCLPVYVGDEILARDVHATWAQLSNACHAHSYELAPTVDELRRWMDVVRRLITVLSVP